MIGVIEGDTRLKTLDHQTLVGGQRTYLGFGVWNSGFTRLCKVLGLGLTTLSRARGLVLGGPAIRTVFTLGSKEAYAWVVVKTQ